MSGSTRASARTAAGGGEIDRTRTIRFGFDGRVHHGHPGDTLASALLAAGVRVFGRSFKYHRPRGVLGAGVEEPNALVTVGAGGRTEPNTRATDVFLYEGLVARSQNRWPSLAFDVGAANQTIARFIPAGFYYKTFLGPPKLWRVYEHFIRRAAGLGPAPRAAEIDAFEHRSAFCDLLVVGAGPAGLAAAHAAALAGVRVFLVEQDAVLGGSLLRDPAAVDGGDVGAWSATVAEAVGAAGGRVLRRTTAAGFWDHGQVTLVERCCEPGQPPEGPVAQRLWRVRAGRVVLATGAIERPLLFAGNDRPGVMLATAARAYLVRWGVRPGSRAVVATCNDDGYRTALALAQAGVAVAAVLDSRARPGEPGPLVAATQAHAPVHFDAHPIAAAGRTLEGLDAIVAGAPRRFECDLAAVSGGFTPVTHLHMQAGGGVDWNATAAAFTPVQPRQNQTSVGAAAGVETLQASLDDGWRAGCDAAERLGRSATPVVRPRSDAGFDAAFGVQAPGAPPSAANPKTAFVDYQNDVTLADVDLAWREGYRSVEHLKRYTTLGMASDQGKTSNVLGLMRLAERERRPAPEVGLTTFRPPYTPVTLGALAGAAVGAQVTPTRRLALHDDHVAAGALWQPSGWWLRPRAFPRLGEGLVAASLREARRVRTTVGLTDVSSLAKYEIAGPDAAAFLERVCATSVAKLGVGRGRYTFMLREDGMVMDDGTVWRLAEDRYLLTSSTGGADRMTSHLGYVQRVLAGGMRVAIANLQEHWAGAALAGPRAPTVLGDLLEGADPPRHMSLAQGGVVAGVRVLVLAASYSGERAFEIYAASPTISPVWRALTHAVHATDGCVYGLEALELLRIEKGHVEVGAEIDGRRTPGDVGLGKMLRPGGGFVGWQALGRPALHAPEREALVGLVSEVAIPEGAMLLSLEGGAPQGHVTSAGRRLTGDGEGAVALALLRGGAARIGETLTASSPTRGRFAAVQVVEPHFHDPGGELYRD